MIFAKRHILIFCILLILVVGCTLFKGHHDSSSVDECGFTNSLASLDNVLVIDTSKIFKEVFKKAAQLASITDSEMLFEANNSSNPMSIIKISNELDDRGIPEQIKIKYSLGEIKKMLNQRTATKFLENGNQASWDITDEDFFDLLFIIYHELGHFLNSDPLRIRNCISFSDRIQESELSADYFAGSMLYRLGINPELNVFKVFYRYNSLGCYPDNPTRIMSAKKGYNDSRKNDLQEYDTEKLKIRPIPGRYDYHLGLRGFNQSNTFSHKLYIDVQDSLLYGISNIKVENELDSKTWEQLQECLSEKPENYLKHKYFAGQSIRGGKNGQIQLYGVNPVRLTDTLLVVILRLRSDPNIPNVIESIKELSLNSFRKELILTYLSDELLCNYIIVENDSKKNLDDFDVYKDHSENQIVFDTIQIDTIEIIRSFTSYLITPQSPNPNSEYIDYGYTAIDSFNCSANTFHIPPIPIKVFSSTKAGYEGMSLYSSTNFDTIGNILSPISVLDDNCF